MDFEIYILDEYLDVIGVINCYSSFIATYKLQEIGDCELQCPATDENIRLLNVDRFIGTSDHPDKLFLITSVSDKHDSEGRTITVNGSSAEVILQRRLYPRWSTVEIPGVGEGYPQSLEQALASLTNPWYFNVYCGAFQNWNNLDENDMDSNLYDLIQNDLQRERQAQEEAKTDLEVWLDFTFSYNINEQKGFYAKMAVWSKSQNPPKAMLSLDLENIDNFEYNLSQDAVYNTVFAVINDRWSGSYHQLKSDGTYEDINVSYDELYYRYKPHEVMAYATLADSHLSITEKTIKIDPVITPYVLTGSEEQDTHERIPMYFNKPAGHGTDPNSYLHDATWDPKGQVRYVWVTKSSGEAEAESYAYQVDQRVTMNNAKAAVNKEIESTIANLTGEVHTEMLHNAIWLGDTVIFRDNDRLFDLVKRIEEVQESYDSSGHRTNITLGERLKTIYDVFEVRR